MAEENQEQTPANEVVLSPVEQKASEQGWVPQDQWEGDADAWRPAKEFLDRGELFKKIDEQSRELKKFKKVVEDLSKHNSNIAKVEYKRALDDLKKQKKEALLDGDADAVIEIDDKIAVVRDAERDAGTQPAQSSSPADMNPVFSRWVDKNSWYSNNKAMRAFADTLGNELGAQGMSVTELLDQVEREVKKEFAEKFQNPNRQRAGSVEGSSTKAGGRSKETFELSTEERRVAERFIKTIPGYTMDKYVEELKKIKGA